MALFSNADMELFKFISPTLHVSRPGLWNGTRQTRFDLTAYRNQDIFASAGLFDEFGQLCFALSQ